MNGQSNSDSEGMIEMLRHCIFEWRQVGSRRARVVRVRPWHCRQCISLIERFGPHHGFFLHDPGHDVYGDSRRDHPEKLRHLKEMAALSVEKRHYRKAAELFIAIARSEPDEPEWWVRAGEALRGAGESLAAAEQLAQAADGFAWRGSLEKAASACKIALLLDPRHRTAAGLLDRLRTPVGPS